MRLYLLVILASSFLSMGALCEAQLRNNDRSSLPTDKAAELARSIGIQPNMLMTASRLAERDPEGIVQLLKTDPSANITASGAVVFGCKLHPGHDHNHSKVPGQHPSAAALQPAPPAIRDVWDEADISKTFQLHSNPASSRKIFLEFTGCVTEGTDGWNKYYEVEKITTPAYDTDGQPDVLSEQELREIITIHAGVAEAYASWDVDVTTENPGFEGIERADEQDQHYGIRVCVGGRSDWTGTTIGGIATLNSFGWVNKKDGEVFRDAFVFSSELTDRDGSVHLGYIWKSIAHEVGHTVGLVHKGFKFQDGKQQEYYTIPPGTGLWAPVMGVPGRGLYVQWSKGEYPSSIDPSSNYDDELQIIRKTLPEVPDEPGTSASNARTFCNNTKCINEGSGWLKTTVLAKVTHPDDKDWYRFTATSTEPFKIQVTVHPNYHKSSWEDGVEQRQTWKMSNLRLDVKFAQHNVKVNPSSVDEWAWQQDFEVTLPKAGKYAFYVQPTQSLNSTNADIVMPSNYGNLGSYQLWVRWPGQPKKQ